MISDRQRARILVAVAGVSSLVLAASWTVLVADADSAGAEPAVTKRAPNGIGRAHAAAGPARARRGGP